MPSRISCYFFAPTAQSGGMSHFCRRLLFIPTILVAMLASLASAVAAPVTDHPRLLFRSSDLPALRARMNANNDVWVAFKTEVVDKALRDFKCSSTSEYRLRDGGTPNNPADDYYDWVRTSFTDENGVLHTENDADWTSGNWSSQAERPAAPEDDVGEATGNVRLFSEQYAMIFSFMARLLDDGQHPVERAVYLDAAKKCLFKVIDSACLGDAAGVPFRHPNFAVNDRSFANEAFALSVDWIYGDLTPVELAKVRKAFLLWSEQCNAHLYFAPHRVNGQHGPPNSPSLLRLDDPDEAARHSEIRLALNNHWANHLRQMGLYGLALDPKDDVPASQVPGTLGVVDDPAPAGSVTSQLIGAGGVNDWVPVDYGVLRDTTGVWLYLTDYAYRHDGAGGLSVEGTQYASNGLGPVALLMAALHSAGQDDASVWGPQVSLQNHPFWSRMIPAYLAMLPPASRITSDPSYSYLGAIFQPPISGDLENYSYVNDQFIKVLAPMALYDARANGAAAPVASAVRYIQRNLAEGGPSKLTTRIGSTMPSKHVRDAIYYFLTMDPAAPLAADPRPALQPATFYSKHTVAGREMGMVIARSGQTANATMFHFRDDWARIDHQRGDSLSFGLWKNGLWLTKVMAGYGVIQGCSDYRNSLGLQNGTPAANQTPVGEDTAAAHGSQWFYSPNGDPEMVARSLADGFVYFTADATPLYNHHAYDNLREIEHASRSIVWLKPDRVVIYDRARSKSAGYYKKFWLNLPDTAANVAVAGPTLHATAREGATAKAELFVTALLPAGAVPQITDISSGQPSGGEDMKSRMFTEAPGAPQDARFLHVVQGANAGVATPDATQLVASADGAFEGALSGDTLVLFRNDLAGVGQSVAFAAPAVAAKIYVTGLTPFAGYDVAGAAGGTISIAPGTQRYTDGGGVLALGGGEPASVEIVTTDASGSESGPEPVGFTLRRSGDVSAPLAVNFTFGGSASTADFAGSPSSVTFAAGSATAVLTLTPVDDAIYEGTEEVIVKLAPGAGYHASEAADEASATLADNDAPPGGTFAFSAPTYSALENGGAFPVSVVRLGGTTGAASVKVSATPGTATPADFAAPPATLSWADGEAGAKTFTVTLTDDAVYEGDETLTLSLASPTGQSGLGSPATSTLTIVDNDPAPPGNFALSVSPAGGTIAENGGTVTFTIARTGGKGGIVSVQVATINGSAVGGSDFTAVPLTTLTWADGETAAKTINVAIIDDSLYEGASEAFSFALTNPTGGATIAGATGATIAITDNDPPPAEFHVGPGQAYATPAEVPWQVVGAGSTVYLHYRAQPYATKLLLSNRGTADNWIKLIGVAGPNGERPILDGENSAVAPGCLPFSSDYDIEDQSLIAVARDATKAAGFKPGYIEIRGLELRHAHPNYAYARQSGGADTFSTYSGAIHLHGAEHVRIADCDIHDNAAGLVSNEGGASESSLVRDVVIENCRFHDNGGAGQYYGHNLRLNAAGVTVQFNRLDAPLSGTNVANVRLIGSGLVVRANFIDGGASQLELTEGYGNLPVLAAEPDFGVTQVVGNVLRNTDGNSGNVVHFGGDEIPGARLLHFHHNTVVVANGYSRTVLNLHGAADTALATNNVFRHSVTQFNLLGGSGAAQFGKNLAVPSFAASAGATGTAAIVTAPGAGFIDEAAADYHLATGSAAIDAAVALPAGALAATAEYVAPASGKSRVLNGAAADLGAFEVPGGGVLQFSSAAATVSESAGTVQLTVTRTGGSYGAVSVNYATVAGTAAAGGDFSPASGQLAWTANDTSSRTITVAIANDTVHEETKAFTVVLSTATGGATLGAASATVTITDDDAAPPPNEFHVGPGQPIAALADVPWASLPAGAKIFLHWQPAAYHEKVLISGRGTAEQPIEFTGVPGPNGELPVIDGTGATTSAALKYTPWFGDVMERSIVAVARNSTQPSSFKPGYIVISNLELTMSGPKTPMPAYTKPDGTGAGYYSGTGAIFLYGGEHVTIRDCVIHDTPNGIVAACETSEGSVTRDLTIERCWLYHAGKGGQYFGNNVMTEAVGLTVQFCRLDRGLNANDNSNLVDRSAGTVIRYNWIQGGVKLVDLIEPLGSPAIVTGDPAFAVAQVYGNVLVNGAGDYGTDGSNLVRYGGYAGNSANFRAGTLHFHHNTAVIDSLRWQTNVFEVTQAAATVAANNNVLHHAKFSAGGGPFNLISSGRTIALGRNWITAGYTLNGVASNGTALVLTGASPGFADQAGHNFRPAAASPLIDAALALPAGALPVVFEYIADADGVARPVLGAAADLGAFEGPN